MTTCRLEPEQLTLYCWGDLSPDEAREVELHLEACASCARERAALAVTLGALDRGSLDPGESAIDWERQAAETLARVSRARGGGRLLRFPLRVPAWVPAGALAKAAVVLLAVGLGAVWLFRGRGPEAPATGPDLPVISEGTRAFQDKLEVNLARADTQRYLEQSAAVLMSVLESPVRCAKDEIDISAEREKSIQLLRKKKLLRNDLSRPELARAASLCNQLESYLTEISTLQNCADLERIQDLRDAVRRNQLLLKIRVLEQELGGTRA